MQTPGLMSQPASSTCLDPSTWYFGYACTLQYSSHRLSRASCRMLDRTSTSPNAHLGLGQRRHTRSPHGVAGGVTTGAQWRADGDALQQHHRHGRRPRQLWRLTMHLFEWLAAWDRTSVLLLVEHVEYVGHARCPSSVSVPPSLTVLHVMLFAICLPACSHELYVLPSMYHGTSRSLALLGSSDDRHTSANKSSDSLSIHPSGSLRWLWLPW